MKSDDQYLVRTPLFPRYDTVRQLIQIWTGEPKSIVLEMQNSIFDQTGTPQNPVDWSNPDQWINERLTGEAKRLARRIWQESDQTVNPRHVYGVYLFINSYELLKPDSTGIYNLTDTGEKFFDNDEAIVRAIDEAEGLPQLLSILSAHSPAKRGDLLEEWGEFLLEHSKFGTVSTIKDTLRRRILNLVDRGYIDREGNRYTITDKGIAYASDTAVQITREPYKEIIQAIKKYNTVQQQTLREKLGGMDPYEFESLIKDLLDAMDYEDVVVTKRSGDKGVDVIAKYQYGITEITEVVQVKRQAGSIGRPVLDQLRGALPYHGAIRGTIITLGTIAKGCKEAALYPGAAPITLIDGNKLMELLAEHSIGFKNRPLMLIEIDDNYFDKIDPEKILEPLWDKATLK